MTTKLFSLPNKLPEKAFLIEYIEREDYSFFLHSRNYFKGHYESNTNS